jgi:hypothetical protein
MAKCDGVDEGAGAVARVEAPPAQLQSTSSALCEQDLCVDLKTVDNTGPRFRDLQSVEPASDAGVSGSLSAAPLAQDVSEEARMPGGADFKVEARRTPHRLFVSHENWTPPSPPPSPPRRQNRYLREAAAIQEVHLADAVDEEQQAPVPGVPEGGGLVGIIISRCMRYLGFP